MVCCAHTQQVGFLDKCSMACCTPLPSALQVEGELVSRAGLEALKPEQFSSILILADESTQFSNTTGGSQVMDADSRSLAALLLMRDLQTRRMRSVVGAPTAAAGQVTHATR